MNIMQEIVINTLVNENHILNENIPNNIIIIGNIDKLKIKYIYDQLDLSKVVCNSIQYDDQEKESIKNHKLPDSLEELDCLRNQLTSLPKLPNSLNKLFCHLNELTSLPDLPNSLECLLCFNNKLTSLPNLPNSLKCLSCSNNQLTSLPDLPNSLEILNCYYNRLTSLPDLPNSLEILSCHNNQLTSLPDLPKSLIELFCSNNELTSLPYFSNIHHKFKINLHQDLPIEYIPYNKNLKLYKKINNKINIKGYPHNPITNQEDLNKYMEYVKNYERNRIKSARN